MVNAPSTLFLLRLGSVANIAYSFHRRAAHQSPEVLNGLRNPSGLIVCAKQPSFALGLLLHRLCAGCDALADYPMGWQVGGL